MSVMTQNYRSSPSVFPQDLSCRTKDSSKFLKQSVDLDDSEKCLPSIATFSHNQLSRTDSPTFSSVKSSKKGQVQRQDAKKKLHKILYPELPKNLRTLSKESSKGSQKYQKGSNLDNVPIVCKECSRTFTSKENLNRHMHTHRGSKPYTCKICGHSYARTSERSQCLRKHEFQKSNNSEPIEPTVLKQLMSGELSAFQIETLVDRSRVRPYVCPICEDHRAYTDPSCLRKHIRSFHPDYREKLVAGKKHLSSDMKQKSEPASINPQSTIDEPMSLVIPPTIELLPLDSTNSTNGAKVIQPITNKSDLLEKPESTIDTDQIPTIMVEGPIDFMNRSWSDEPSSSSSVVVAATTSYIPVIAVNLVTDQTVILGTELEASECNAELDNPNVPIDLCNSALCLQVFVDKIETLITNLSNEQESGDSTSPIAVNLTSFGEFLIWTAKGAEQLRRKHRIVGRASMSAESSKKVRGAQGKADSLPIRLSFEEVNLCLYQGFIQGFYHTSPVSLVSEPSVEQINQYEEELKQNVIESTKLHQAQRRLRLVGHYSQLLDGRKIHFKRAMSKRSDTVHDGQTPNQDDKPALSIRAERRLRRSRAKRRRKHFTNPEDIEYDYTSGSDDNRQISLDSDLDRLPTLDELIDEYNSDLLSKSDGSTQNFYPQTAQHLPRPTPNKWRRDGERKWVALEQGVRSKGFYAVALWLYDQMQTCRKSTETSSLQTRELQLRKLLSRSRIYADLWTKNLFITTSTIKMGGDFLVYQGDPLLHHGSHIVSITLPEEAVDPRQLSAKLRIANSLRKILVLANVPKISESVNLDVLRSDTNPHIQLTSDDIAYITLQYVSNRTYQSRNVDK